MAYSQWLVALTLRIKNARRHFLKERVMCKQHWLVIVMMVLGSGAACAQESCVDPLLIADMREFSAATDASSLDANKPRIAEDLFDGNSAFTVNTRVTGSFTSANMEQTLYVVQKDGPDATSPQAQTVTIAIYDADRLVERYSTAAGNFALGKVRLRTTDSDAVLLRADHYQMGTMTSQLSLVSFSDEKLNIVATFDEALVNRCEDERFGGDVEAVVINQCGASDHANTRFHVSRYTARCEDGRPPAAEKFVAKAPMR
jgi:hypothetical protein